MANFFDKYDLYTEGDSIYCYPSTTVLKNKLSLRDYETLKAAETDFVSARLLELELEPLDGIFDKKHLFAIHKYLFQDIYDFAGKARKEDISKGNTKFCVHLYIDDQLDELFKKLGKYLKTIADNKASKLDFLVFTMAELNIIHPFREGNGRSIREFIREYALKFGFSVEWDAVEKEQLLDAMISSVYDVSDLKFCLNKIIR